MKTYTCHTCDTPVARRDAVLRGNAIDPQPRAWHPACFPELLVPGQRAGSHDALPTVWPQVERVSA